MRAWPVFVVGSPRSGTSILVLGLLGAGYFGFSEGNFLSLITMIDRQVDRHFTVFGSDNPRVLTSRIDKNVLKANLTKVLADAVAAQHEGKVWFDKTGNPEMIEAIPSLLAIWPGAHFIFAKRRAIENIMSRILKFPKHTFEYHCADWARNMLAWRVLMQNHPTLPSLEVDQRDINDSPEATAAMICKFLQVPPEDQAKMATIFAREQPQRSGPGSAGRTFTLESTGWTEPQQQVFHRYCDEAMRAFGYTEDQFYKTDAPEALV
jgi:hypothetical protein